MKEAIKRTNLMEKALITSPMVTYMKENGKRVRKMEKVKKKFVFAECDVHSRNI
jgi:hypothetical protein